jgi:quercetin dioxygenase-like cupin family protein
MSGTSSGAATWYRWESMPREVISSMIERRLVTGDRLMIAHVYIKKDGVVPLHSHDNEQVTYILEGALRLWVGADGSPGQAVHDVRAGEVLVIPSNVPHRAVALEDTLDVDVFCPPRQDWLDGTDRYLRGEQPAAASTRVASEHTK